MPWYGTSIPPILQVIANANVLLFYAEDWDVTLFDPNDDIMADACTALVTFQNQVCQLSPFTDTVQVGDFVDEYSAKLRCTICGTGTTEVVIVSYNC